MKREYIHSLTTVLSFMMMTLAGCYYDVEEELYPAGTLACDTTNVTYATSIEPILQNNCYSCHTGSAPSGNINLLGYSNVKMYADNGSLLGAITHASGFTPMPFGGNKLDDCKIMMIQTWINKGTLDN
jgi:hypothetical protein